LPNDGIPRCSAATAGVAKLRSELVSECEALHSRKMLIWKSSRQCFSEGRRTGMCSHGSCGSRFKNSKPLISYDQKVTDLIAQGCSLRSGPEEIATDRCGHYAQVGCPLPFKSRHLKDSVFTHASVRLGRMRAWLSMPASPRGMVMHSQYGNNLERDSPGGSGATPWRPRCKRAAHCAP